MIAESFIGIDYHQKSVQLCVISASGKKLGNRKLDNDVAEVIRYASSFGRVKGGAIEVSCGAAHFVAELRSRTGWDVRLCHPGYVNRMKHNPDKSDKSDTELIADLCRVGYLPEVWLATEEERDVKQLIRFRSQHIQSQRELKQRIRALFRQFRILPPQSFDLRTKRSKAWAAEASVRLPRFSATILCRHLSDLSANEELVKQLEKEMSGWAKNDPLCIWLMGQRGIGLITAMLIRTEIATASRFKNGKQLARFCGVTPRNASSGERQADAGLVRAGNPDLKRTLLQVAHILRRCDSHWRNFAASLLSRGKAVNVVIAAIANRWVRRLFHEMRKFEQRTLATI